eukprot:jgi/Bigna1/86855/estExt_fgenesh1_pg.C_140152
MSGKALCMSHRWYLAMEINSKALPPRRFASAVTFLFFIFQYWIARYGIISEWIPLGSAVSRSTEEKQIKTALKDPKEFFGNSFGVRTGKESTLHCKISTNLSHNKMHMNRTGRWDSKITASVRVPSMMGDLIAERHVIVGGRGSEPPSDDTQTFSQDSKWKKSSVNKEKETRGEKLKPGGRLIHYRGSHLLSLMGIAQSTDNSAKDVQGSNDAEYYCKGDRTDKTGAGKQLSDELRRVKAHLFDGYDNHTNRLSNESKWQKVKDDTLLRHGLKQELEPPRRSAVSCGGNALDDACEAAFEKMTMHNVSFRWKWDGTSTTESYYWTNLDEDGTKKHHSTDKNHDCNRSNHADFIPRCKGIIRWYRSDKGYGFVHPDSITGMRRLFLRPKNFMDDKYVPRVGDKVFASPGV